MVFLPYSFPTHVSFLLTSSICQCLDFHFFQEKFRLIIFRVFSFQGDVEHGEDLS